jgi:hypothetical protein
MSGTMQEGRCQTELDIARDGVATRVVLQQREARESPPRRALPPVRLHRTQPGSPRNGHAGEGPSVEQGPRRRFQA